MVRAANRQSETARLKDLLNSAREIAEQRRLELIEVRRAAKQIWDGLMEFAREENWKIEGTLTDDGQEIDRYVWKAGDGPQLARKFLGLEQERN